MRFWKILRWGATIAFLALLLASWLGAGPATSPGIDAIQPARTAPTIHR